jgi:23S rRNA pseudouridine955/2504/2580 synthase
MKSWKVENPGRLLTEVKNKFIGLYTTKDVRWSIEHNRCFVNKRIERFGSAPLKKGDIVSIWIDQPPSFCKEKTSILYEDSHILVYNKPPYLTCEKLAAMTGNLLVHRLDRDTSGIILLAKNKETQAALEREFRQRTIHKGYLARVKGRASSGGTISGKMAPLHRREGSVMWGMSPKGVWSQTDWQCLHHQGNTSLLHCIPHTGRTHQIRVHLKHIGHPIVGDYTYGSSQKEGAAFRPLLHACGLTFVHPATHVQLTFSSPPPPDFGLQP